LVGFQKQLQAAGAADLAQQHLELAALAGVVLAENLDYQSELAALQIQAAGAAAAEAVI
jgi:hypothetical protein